MANSIPALSRGLVIVRERYLCARCGCKGTDVHHRRGKSVVDQHQHCPCNLILLCHKDHMEAHRQPLLARVAGVIVSRYTDEPGTVPVETMVGEVTLDCDGGFRFVRPAWQTPTEGVP